MGKKTETYNQEQVYSEYYPKVLQYIQNHTNGHMDAEDIAQNVFLKVFGKWDTFDPEKSSISTWIFNIMRNTLIDHQRSMSYRQHDELSEFLADDSDDMLDTLIMEEEQERLANALETLSQEERDLIILFYYGEHTLLDIAEMMHRPYGQIKRLHTKALNKLKQQMEPKMGSTHLRIYRG